MEICIGILIPFLGTTLGSLMVLLMKKELNIKLEKSLLGVASGVMIAASIWSLLIPAIDMAEEQNIISWIPATIGFLLGIFFLIWIDKILSILKNNADIKLKLDKNMMLILGVTIHNIPEGMAIGVVWASILSGTPGVTIMSAFTLAIGIAIQNIPEGAIISMPLNSSGTSKKESLKYGIISGIVEPIAAMLTLFLTSTIVSILPYLLSFAAGAMIYVVIEELIPEAQKGDDSYLTILGTTFGFLIMMILDVTLG